MWCVLVIIYQCIIGFLFFQMVFTGLMQNDVYVLYSVIVYIPFFFSILLKMYFSIKFHITEKVIK